MTKARLISLLLIASLCAYILACFHGFHGGPHGMSDGGGF